MCWGLDGLDLATDVVFFDLVAQVCNGRVCGVVRAEDLDCLLHSIGLVDVVDCNRCSVQAQESGVWSATYR